MPASSVASSSAPERIRRRRITTACLTCRNRRVKCNRSRPTCDQCSKAGKTCKYADDDPKTPKVEFMDEPALPPAIPSSNPSSDTWNSVIQHQVALIQKADVNKDVPVWAVAEAEEPSRVRDSLIEVPRSYVTPLSAVREDFPLEISNEFPSRQICDPFFEAFILGVHPIAPICHVPTLRKLYSNFWSNISPSYSVETLALILAVLYTGAVNSRVIDTNFSALLNFYERIFASIDFTSYHARNSTAAIQLLQSCIIMNTYKCSHMAPFAAYGFLPQVIRFAQAMRLHADKKSDNVTELEVRRRIWWHLLFLDVESIIATGLPPIIHRAGYTTSLPSLRGYSVKDDREMDFDPMTIAMQGHYQWAYHMQIWFETLPSHDEVSRFKSLITNSLDLIPDINVPENQWARTYLKMQIDRAYCMLGLRFWQLDQYKGTGCHSEVVRTAISFLTHYLHLSAIPSTHHFWFIPGLIQPLHALIILLMHLSTCPNIPAEETSRNLLDKVLSVRVNHIMRGSPFPVVTALGARERPSKSNPRYLILVELKKRVWRKTGWDSDGRDMDPWGGRMSHMDGEKDEVVGMEKMGEMVKEEGVAVGENQVNTDMLNAFEWSPEYSTGLDELDNILAGDPMDMFQWDEWESLASEFFAS